MTRRDPSGGDGVFEGASPLLGALFPPHDYLARLPRATRTLLLDVPLASDDLLDLTIETGRRSAEERDMCPSELFAARAAVVTHSGTGIVPVRNSTASSRKPLRRRLVVRIREAYEERTRDPGLLVAIPEAVPA